MHFFWKKVAKKFASSKNVRNFAPQFQTGALVQLVRMPACHAGGRWFESCTHRSGERRRAKMCFGTIRSFFFVFSPVTSLLRLYRDERIAYIPRLLCQPARWLLLWGVSPLEMRILLASTFPQLGRRAEDPRPHPHRHWRDESSVVRHSVSPLA